MWRSAGKRRRCDMSAPSTFSLTIIAAAALAGAAWAKEKGIEAEQALDVTKRSERPLRLELDLVDGSRIVGVPGIETVPVQTAYAKMDVPLKQIRTMKIGKDRETVSLDLQNGDKLKGVVNLDAIEIATVFGKVSVPLGTIINVVVTATAGDAATTGLVLHYTFDDDAAGKVNDHSGCGNHGQIAGNVTYESSFSGKAIRPHEPRSGVVCTAKALNADNWTELSACAWVMLKGGGSPYGPILARGEVTGEKYGFCGMRTGGPHHGPWHPGNGFVVLEQSVVAVLPRSFAKEVNPQPAIDRWYHVALTYDGRKVCMYVDGELEASTKAEPPFQKVKDWPDTKLVIGSGYVTPSIDYFDQYFDGLIDEVRIYRRALSEDEVKRIHSVPNR